MLLSPAKQSRKKGEVNLDGVFCVRTVSGSGGLGRWIAYGSLQNGDHCLNACLLSFFSFDFRRLL